MNILNRANARTPHLWPRVTVKGLSVTAALAATCLCSPALAVSVIYPTTNAQGYVGRTDYSGFPFGSSIYANSWGSVNALPGNSGLAPSNLFWSSGTFFQNASYMAGAKNAAADLATKGIVPSGSAQRWEDTYEAGQPASNFGPSEPSWIASDRANYGSPLPNLPEYKAWTAWTNARPGLEALASDGGSMGQDFRPWGGTWGHISPEMPLAATDCPTGMLSCTYGDWYADRWAQTTQASGAFGLVLSDFAASLPSQPSWLSDFNPAIIAKFSKQSHLPIPIGTAAQQSQYIVANMLPQWNDFITKSYADFFSTLSNRITAATGQQALIVAGGFDWPGLNRSWGVDERMMADEPKLAKHLLVVWDSITIETDRDGANITQGMAGPIISAAREPRIRNGAYLCASDSNFTAAVAQFNPTLSATDQQEWGAKQLKRQWLEFSWAHIGTRHGAVRRALAFAWRDHWDAGTVDPVTTRLMQTITPTAPFGFGLYYSAAVERAMEPKVPTTLNAYLSPNDLLAFRQAIPLNYYVSDVSLPALKAKSAPAAWIVLDAGTSLPPSELAALTKIAPVLTSIQQASTFANAPLAFTNGLTGTGFYDQYKRVIVTVTNPSTAASAAAITGSIVLKGLPNGTHTMADLYTGASVSFTAANGVASVPVSVTRWDTLAFAITL